MNLGKQISSSVVPMPKGHIHYNSIYKIFFLLLCPRCSTSPTEQMGLLFPPGSFGVPGNLWDMWDSSYLSAHCTWIWRIMAVQKKVFPTQKPFVKRPAVIKSVSIKSFTLFLPILPKWFVSLCRLSLILETILSTRVIMRMWCSSPANDTTVLWTLHSVRRLMQVMPKSSGITSRAIGKWAWGRVGPINSEKKRKSTRTVIRNFKREIFEYQRTRRSLGGKEKKKMNLSNIFTKITFLPIMIGKLNAKWRISFHLIIQFCQEEKKSVKKLRPGSFSDHFYGFACS